MKKTKKLRALMFSMAMAFAFMLPTTMTAQSDGFFRGGGETYENRNDGVTWNGMVAQNPSEPVPLGSGLLILTAAGAGYVALRSKRNLKTTATMLLACVMLLGLTQCKKKAVETVTPAEGITMTLVADNGAKTSFDEYCNISWETNERVFVFVEGVCRGSLTNGSGGGNTFTGTLTPFEAGTYNFYFYYLGSNATESTIKSGATSFSMDFSNQDGTHANLGKNHFGCGIMEYVNYDGGSTISAQTWMHSYVSVGLFNTTGMANSGEKVYFYGDIVNNNILVEFVDNVPTYNYRKTNSGYICAGEPSDKTYVILVPNHTNGSEPKPTEFTFVSKRTTGTVAGSKFQYGIIGDRFYCEGGIINNAISITKTAYDGNILRGDFSVASGTTVKFSAGNLQYIGSAATPYWKFADQQYDYLGTTTGQNSAAANVDRDMFGWGASGWNSGNVYYQPYDTYMGTSSESSDDAGAKYGPNGAYSLTDANANADWGVYNRNNIKNGGTHEWRTLTKAEWEYLFNEKTRGSNRFLIANIGVGSSYNGVILFPDNYDGAGLTGSYTYNNKSGWTSVSAGDWYIMEASGAAFLPASGYRNGIEVANVGNQGLYWTSTHSNNHSAYRLEFNSGSVSFPFIHRFGGRSVRLVF